MNHTSQFLNYLVLLSYLLCSLSINHHNRTNLCEIHRRVERKEISLALALKGVQISIVMDENLLDRKDPSISWIIFDEIVRRSQLNYVAFGSPRIAQNETWTDVLMYRTQNFDLALGQWDRTIERLGLGIIYPEPWFNADTILVSRKFPEEQKFVFWAFSKPFSLGLWLLLLSTLILTGAIFHFLDFLYSSSRNTKISSNFEESIFKSIYSYTGSRSVFLPKSLSAQILTISMAFLYLILVSAYTANLANYFVIKSRPPTQINDINDVIYGNKVICAARGYASTMRLQKEYENARILEGESETEALAAVSDGKCDVAAISMGNFERFERDIDYNKHCDLEWVGRQVFLSESGFAVKDSENLCSSVLVNVLDYHLLQMKNEGRIHDISKAYRQIITADTCKTRKKTNDKKNTSLSILNLGGAFTFHFSLILVSLIVAFYDHKQSSSNAKYDAVKEVKHIFSKLFMSSICSTATKSDCPSEKVTSSFSRNEKVNTDLQSKSGYEFRKKMVFEELLKAMEVQKREIALKLDLQKNLEILLKKEMIQVKKDMIKMEQSQKKGAVIKHCKSYSFHQ